MRQARRSRPTSSRPISEEGYTLVEVMVAMLLTSIMVTSVFSVALTVKTGGGKGESKMKAAAMTRQVTAVLKNYVTAETGTASTSAPFAGPCVGAANNWSMTCNGITDACPGGSPHSTPWNAGANSCGQFQLHPVQSAHPLPDITAP